MRGLRGFLLLLACLFAIAGCRAGSGGAGGEETAAPPPGAVTMSVTAARVVVAPIRSELRLLGTTVAARHLQLRAPTAGRVLDFNLQNGDRVRRGQIVARVLNREIEAAANGLAVAERLDPAGAPAIAQSVKRYGTGGGVAVVAPADAIVAQRLVSTGQLVNEMDALADLIDPRSVYVEAAVPIDAVSAVRPGMEVVVTSPMAPAAELPGRVVALSPSVTSNGATLPVRIEFGGAERIAQAGAPVEVRVTTAAVSDAIVIPAAALFVDSTGSYVFLVGAGGRAHRTAIATGIRSGGSVQVTSGIRAGDLVITSGGYALADGLNVRITGPAQ